MKIRNTGLDDFFDRQHVLTTGDAAEPEDDRKQLAVEKAKLQEQENSVIEEDRVLDKALALLNRIGDKNTIIIRRASRDVNNVANATKIQDEQITGVIAEEKNILLDNKDTVEQAKKLIRQRLKVTNFVGEVLNRMAKKGGIAFYSAAIRAILEIRILR